MKERKEERKKERVSYRKSKIHCIAVEDAQNVSDKVIIYVTYHRKFALARV